MGLKNFRSDATKKADRKFEKKLEFYSKVRETVASLSATKAIAKSRQPKAVDSPQYKAFNRMQEIPADVNKLLLLERFEEVWRVLGDNVTGELVIVQHLERGGRSKSDELKSKSARKRQKKLKAYDLSLLNEVLPEVKESQQPAPPPKKLNCKSRQKLVIKETKRMEAVLNHPAFQSDPFAAIHRYLVNTQPAPKAEPVKKKSKDDAKKKRKKTKSSSKPQSMEM